MLQPRIATPLRRTLLEASTSCFGHERHTLPRVIRKQISNRSFTSAHVLYRPVPDTTPTKPTVTPPTPDPRDDGVFVPKPLGRPIGFRTAPQPGENATNPKTSKDYSGMTMSERNLAKRKDLVNEWGTSYFRDFKNITKHRSGKTFMANPRIFRKDAALYFPNFVGDTLEGRGKSTTDVLEGVVSVVNVYSSDWGAAQARTFTGLKENGALHELLKQSPHAVQMVDVNIEENKFKAWLLDLFQFRLRASKPKEEWGKYFVVKKGVSTQIRETIGLLNGRVGYIYLLDQDCKIRWAGSGNAEGSEMDDLNRGVGKLVAEASR